MIYLIICGHGEFAGGIHSGAQLLCGSSEHCDAINFSEGMSSDALKQKLQASVSKAGDMPVLFLTDILGGTPFRECATLCANLDNSEVISGANLQMLTEALMERDEAENVRDFARMLVESAKECMKCLSDELAAQKTREENSTDDGI